MDKKIILYTTHCPKCRVLETKLQKAGVEYDECDDLDVMLENGFKSAPVLVVDGTVFEFGDAVRWANERARA